MNDQKIAGKIHAYGCYALCLAEIGNRLVEITKEGTNTALNLAQVCLSYSTLLENGIITENLYVQNPEQLLAEIFPGHKWSVTKSDKNPGYGPVIATNNQHFVCCNDADEIIYNPLGEENNVVWRKLPIHSYRVVKLIK